MKYEDLKFSLKGTLERNIGNITIAAIYLAMFWFSLSLVSTHEDELFRLFGVISLLFTFLRFFRPKFHVVYTNKKGFYFFWD